jgi:hypothetical protein
VSLSSRDSRGLVGNAAAGYGLAWAHRRQLLSVLLPVLATAWIGLVLLDLLLGRDHLVIIDGVPVVRGGDGEVLAWARLGLVAAFWLLALSAAAMVATGAARGHAVRPGKAILAAVRHFPVFAIGMCTVAGATILGLWALAGLVGSGPVGIVLILGALAAAGVVSARMLVGLISHQLGGSDWRLTRGRVAGTAGAFLLGGVVVPLAAAGLLPGVPQPVVARAIGAVLLTGLVAVQAGILAHVYLLQRESGPQRDSGPQGEGEPQRASELRREGGPQRENELQRASELQGESGQESVDLAGVDALLAEMSGRAPGRPWAGVVAMVVAVLAPVGVGAVNLSGAPAVRSHGDAPGGVVAVAWPAGRHPVIATMTGARFCDNDVCDRYVARNGGPAVMDDIGTAGISADGGTVVKASLTGGLDNGGPFIHYARCTRAGCREAWLPVRASAKEAFGWPDLAVAVAPDQAVWFVVAMPSADDEPGPATSRITFIRCADAGCAKPQRHQAGTVERIPDDGSLNRRRAQLSIGADGRPVATVRTGMQAFQVTCEPVNCAAPRNTVVFVGQAATVWTATPDGLISLRPGMVQVGEQMVGLDGGEFAPLSGAVAVAGPHVYATAAEETTPPGFHLTIGTPAERADHWQQVLWRCDLTACRRQVLDAFEAGGGPEMLAVAADGRVLIVRSDRILLFSS